MTEKTLSPEVVASLSMKLDELSEALTPDEHAVLLGLIGMASSAMEASHAEAESEGLTTDRAIVNRPTAKPLPKLSSAIADTFKAVPGIGGGLGPISDSVGVGWLCVSWSKDLNEFDNPRDVVVNPSALRLAGMKLYR